MVISNIDFEQVERVLFYGQSFGGVASDLLATVDIKNLKHEETLLLGYNDSGTPGPEPFMAERVDIIDADDKKYSVLKILKPSIVKKIVFIRGDGNVGGEIDFTVDIADSSQYSNSVVMISYGQFDMDTDPTIFLHEYAKNAHYVDIKLTPFEVTKGTGVHPNFVRGAILPGNSQVVGQNLIHRNFKVTYLGNMINDRFNANP